MKNVLLSLIVLFSAQFAFANARVMNAGEAKGQIVVLTVDDVKTETQKYRDLSPLSIPVFGELPLDMSVVAGAITLQQQTLLSHVQLKSRARGTPNLDIAQLPDGMKNPLLASYKDGDWIHMKLTKDEVTGKEDIYLAASTEADAIAFHEARKVEPVTLESDLSVRDILTSDQMSSADYVRVGTKAANYAELARLLNTPERTVVRPSWAIPLYYYQEFIDMNPAVKASIDSILRDPLMSKVAKVSYRELKLIALRNLMMSDEVVVNDELVDNLLQIFDTVRTPAGKPRKMKLRSSTNSEDLPTFNGAGLYSSASYDPTTKGIENAVDLKRLAIKKALLEVWASVWNLRAYDERVRFGIPHSQVKMGMQINPSYPRENADGVIVTKNMSGREDLKGPGVYIEVQRGSEYSVTNPVTGVKPQQILVQYNPAQPLDKNVYQIHVLQNSNVADDNITILAQDNPVPVMSADEIRDLAYQVMKAHLHFGPLLDPTNTDFSLDLEFKVDSEDTGKREIYIKQARPYID